MRDEIIAGPSAVKYREYSFYFFEVGLRLAYTKKTQDDRKDLINILRYAYSGDRFLTLSTR